MSLAAGGKKVTDQQVAQAAYNAGFRGQALVEIVARQFVEASNYADNVNDASGARGLWQILPSAHPEYAAQLSGTAWEDPQTNANMAFSIWQRAGNSMSPWAADGSAWIPYVPRATAAVALVKGVDAVGPTSAGSDGNTATATQAGFSLNPFDWVGQIFHPLVEFLIEAGMVIGGAILLLFGGKLLWDEVGG